MKMQDSKNSLLWLIKPEDSSSYGTEGTTVFSSITKFITWYVIALVIGFLLSRLH